MDLEPFDGTYKFSSGHEFAFRLHRLTPGQAVIVTKRRPCDKMLPHIEQLMGLVNQRAMLVTNIWRNLQTGRWTVTMLGRFKGRQPFEVLTHDSGLRSSDAATTRCLWLHFLADEGGFGAAEIDPIHAGCFLGAMKLDDPEESLAQVRRDRLMFTTERQEA